MCLTSLAASVSSPPRSRRGLRWGVERSDALSDQLARKEIPRLHPLPFGKGEAKSSCRGRLTHTRLVFRTPLVLANWQRLQTVTKKEKRMSQENQLVANYSHGFSRRRFIASAGVLTAAAWLSPRHLPTTTRVEGWDFTSPPSPAGAIPTEVFDREKTLYLNSTTIALSYYGPSHTDGDVSAYFVEAEVFHTGDTWWNGHYPFIDYSTAAILKA